MKRLLLLTFLLGCLGAAAQDVNIPDANFKAALLAHDPVIDTNGDDEIQVTEAEAFDGLLNVSRLNITDATGLEAFINIKKLDISNNSGLNALDVSANTELTFLNSAILPITAIDLSQNTMLDTLYLFRCELASIDLSNNSALIQVWLTDNNLTSLDVTNNLVIKSLFFGQNQISTFNYPPIFNTSLEALDFGDNPLANTFDFTIFPNLKDLRCSGSELTSLDVSMFSDLEILLCSNNPITNLDLSQNTSLTILLAGGTLIKDLDLSQNPNMIQLNLSTHELSNDYLSAIETINLANGNNDKMEFFFLLNNYNLACIQVDNPSNPFPNLTSSNFDGFTNFTDNCVGGAIFFADAELENALLEHDPIIDVNADGIITEVEAMAFTGTLNLADRPIKNAREISFFTNITDVNLSRTEVRNLDLSQNTQLTNIDLSYMTKLRVLSLDNGNNEAITTINWIGWSVSYPLRCITVDDPVFAENNWTTTPAHLGFSIDCDVTMFSGFETRLVGDGYDLNGDSKIQVSEAEAITGELDLFDSFLGNISGIEALINVAVLNVGVNSLSNSGIANLDVTQNSKLSKLLLLSNKLTSLDLSCNSRLKELDLGGSRRANFNSIDLSHNTSLQTLNMAGGFFNELDVSASSRLVSLDVRSNDLKDLDLSNNHQFRSLRATLNDLRSLNLANGNNENIFLLDVRNNPDLTCISVDDVAYAEANFTNVDAGVSFDPNCPDRPIEFQDINLKNALLNYSPVIDLDSDDEIRPSEAAAFAGVLNLSGLNISTALELEYFTGATGLDISNNQLTELNIKNGNNENFTIFDATGNAGLTCIKVDNAAYATANWTNVDAGASFSAYCDTEEIVYIPDEDLKKVVVTFLGLDTSGDGEISYGEAIAFTGNLDLDQLNIRIADMTGIEAFENITGFECGRDNTMTELDLSAFDDLTSFSIVQNNNSLLAPIDISYNVLLETISISRVSIANFDLTTYSNLTTLSCNNCELTSVDLSQNPQLTYLSLYNNQLTDIDISSNTLLTTLSLDYNQLSSLDLTSLTSLEQLYASGNNFTSLDVSTLINLKTINIEEPKITSIDLSNNPLIEQIHIYGGEDDGMGGVIIGELREITFPANPTKLGRVDLSYNKIQNIDISNIPLNPDVFGQADLSFIDIYNNDLTNINIGKVYELNIRDNPNLVCATTTDIVYAEANYSYDEGLFFSTEACATPTDIVLSSASFDENSVGAVGTFTTTDESVNDVHEYTFFEDGTETSNALFEIIDDELFPKTSFDFENENEPTYLIQVQSDDGFGGIFEKQFTITLNDVNEAPTLIELSNNSIDESNPVGTVIGILSTEDVDAGDSHTYTTGFICENCASASHDEGDLLQIVGNELRTGVVFDFETGDPISLRIRSTDSDGLFTEEDFVISINDLPAQVTSLEISNQSINENEDAGSIIGSFSTTGEDLSGSFTYTLASGDGDDDNGSFSISGDQVLTSASFDFEEQSSYSIRVMTDDGTLTREEAFTITVNNVSEAPTDLLISETSIAENNATNVVIGSLTTTDDDEGESFTYNLVSGGGDIDNGSFNINGDELRATDVFDFETKSSYSVRVETNDGNGGTYQEAFTITITNENESISVTNPIEDQSQEEGFGSINIELSDVFSDEDGDALTYSASSSDASVITVSNSGTTLTITEVGVGTAMITVTADDGSGVTTSDEFEVTVTAAPLGFEDDISLEIYPNPTKDFVNIKSDKQLQIILFNLNGQTIRSGNGQTVRMDLRNLSSGTYLLKITDGELTSTRRIIKAN